jgi:transposase
MKSQRLSEEAAKMYAEGMAVEAVAKQLGVAYRTARKAIRAGGIEFRDPSQRLVGRTRPDRKVGVNA